MAWSPALATAFVIGTLTVTWAAGQTARSDADSLRTEADRIFRQWTAASPGCAVGVARDGRTILRTAYGLASLEHSLPNTPETVFDAGSVAKQFTAAAVLLLARDGRLSLDDPVRKHVPELPAYDVEPTIRQMLQHTSGLRDWSTIAGIAGWPRSIFGQGDAHVLDTPYAHGQVRILDVLSRQRSLNFPPGSRWLYSNSGYVLAALIVSRVSGTSFAEFTKRRIFDPLGMKDTSWQQDHTRIVPRRATGYAQYVGGFRTDAPLVVVDGGGGLLTTVDDLLAWNENFTRLTVGDAAMMAAMHQRAPLGDGRTHEYALGLVADTYKGVPEVDHSGGTQGFRAHLARYPDQRVSIAVLCNVTTANPTAYAKALADVLLATSLRPPAPPAAPSYTLTRDAAEPLAGLYRRSPEVGATRILPDANGLSFESGRRLTPTAPGRFVTSDGALTIEFDRPGRFRAWDEFGIVDVYDRVEPAAPTSDQLKAFAGTYVADEVDAAFTVVLDGKQLSMRRRPDTTIPLTAAFADGFATPIGFVVFERDAAGRVSGFTLTHARVWNLRFIRSDAPPRP